MQTFASCNIYTIFCKLSNINRTAINRYFAAGNTYTEIGFYTDAFSVSSAICYIAAGGIDYAAVYGDAVKLDAATGSVVFVIFNINIDVSSGGIDCAAVDSYISVPGIKTVT